jgi:hypothetical protein
MTDPADAEARRRILAEYGTSFFVEAAAGTGKTTALVGRIVGRWRASWPPGWGIAAGALLACPARPATSCASRRATRKSTGRPRDGDQRDKSGQRRR